MAPIFDAPRLTECRHVAAKEQKPISLVDCRDLRQSRSTIYALCEACDQQLCNFLRELEAPKDGS